MPSDPETTERRGVPPILAGAANGRADRPATLLRTFSQAAPESLRAVAASGAGAGRSAASDPEGPPPPSADAPGPVALRYPDVVLVLIATIPVLALGAPVLGYAVGGAAWIVQRAASVMAERRIAQIRELRPRLGYGVGLSMLRVWVLAGAIVAAGVGGTRPDGLTAALVIFGAFSAYFARSAFEQITRKRGRAR